MSVYPFCYNKDREARQEEQVDGKEKNQVHVPGLRV